MTVPPPSGPPAGGAPGQNPGTPPDPQQRRLRELRRRGDKVYGIILLVIGLGAAVVSMSSFTETALAAQYAALFEEFDAGPYLRPAGLTALSWVGILVHPVIYAVTLYLTLLRWRRRKPAAWIPVIGALVSLLFSWGLLAIGTALHPALLAAATAVSPLQPGTTGP